MDAMQSDPPPQGRGRLSYAGGWRRAALWGGPTFSGTAFKAPAKQRPGKFGPIDIVKEKALCTPARQIR